MIFGVNSDHVVTVFTFFSCLFLYVWEGVKNNNLFNRFNVIFLVTILLYLTVNLIFYNVSNVVLVISLSLYISIAFFFTSLFKGNEIFLSKIIAGSLLIVSSFLLIQLYHLGFGDWHRLTVPVYTNGQWQYFPYGYESSSDPNVLAFMLCISSIYIFFTLPNKKIANVIFVLSITCSFLTLSRSSFLSFVFSFLIVYIYSYFILKKKQSRLCLLFVISIVLALFVMKSVNSDYLNFHSDVSASNSIDDNQQLIDSLKDRMSSESSNDDRMTRLKYALGQLDNIETILIGKGIGTSLKYDPHNFYLSTIIDTGIFVLAIILILITKPLRMIYYSKDGDPNFLLCCMFITLYFLVIALFYWQVRVLFFTFTLLFVLLNKIREKQ